MPENGVVGGKHEHCRPAQCGKTELNTAFGIVAGLIYRSGCDIERADLLLDLIKYRGNGARANILRRRDNTADACGERARMPVALIFNLNNMRPSMEHPGIGGRAGVAAVRICQLSIDVETGNAPLRVRHIELDRRGRIAVRELSYEVGTN